MIIKLLRNKRRSIKLFTTIAVFFVTLTILSLFYLQSINKSEDPRIFKAKILYSQYEDFMKKNNQVKAFETLDSIELLYKKYSDYKNSFEMGQLMNSKAVNYIKLALAEKNDSTKTHILDTARIYAESSVEIFENWLIEYKSLTRNEIIIKIEGNYSENYQIFKNRSLVKIINKRADELIVAQDETPRHLSVAYTNLGLIYQYMGNSRTSMETYRRALEIWNQNETAKKNIKNLIDRSIK